MKYIKNLPYRPCVGIMLFNRERKIFTGNRIDSIDETSDAWQMPQGGIDEGESPQNAAIRELIEETGITRAAVIHESKQWYHYDIPAHCIPKFWNGKYRGQIQKWYLMEFTGDDEHININTEIPEFKEWKWQYIANIPNNIIKFKRKLYQDIVNEFTPILQNWK